VGEAVKLAKEVDAKEVDKVAAKAKVIRWDSLIDLNIDMFSRF
jgi:hypothetical protein